MPRAEIAGEGGRDRGEDLRSPRAAEVARDERDQDHDQPHLEGRQHPDGRRRDPEQRDRCGGEQRRERRLVDVAECRVQARHDVVHLVAVEAVGARDGQQPDDHQTRDQEHRPGDGVTEIPDLTSKLGSQRQAVPALLDDLSGGRASPVLRRPESCKALRSTNSICPFRLRRSSFAHRWSASSTSRSMRSRKGFRSATNHW